MANQINTAKVKRRSLRFESLDAALTELDRIVAAEKDGKLRTLGNWTPGQVLGHVAAWIDYGYDGYPLKGPPRIVRWIIQLRAKKYLEQGLPAGVRIPNVENGTVGLEAFSTADGAAKLRSAIERLKRGDAAKFDSPAFGSMSHEDRIRLNLRHGELHMGFLEY